MQKNQQNLCYKITNVKSGKSLYFKRLKNVRNFLGCSRNLLEACLNPFCCYNHTAKGHLVERVTIDQIGNHKPEDE